MRTGEDAGESGLYAFACCGEGLILDRNSCLLQLPEVSAAL